LFAALLFAGCLFAESGSLSVESSRLFAGLLFAGFLFAGGWAARYSERSRAVEVPEALGCSLSEVLARGFAVARVLQSTVE
jgi:hypothetical protein